METNEALKTVVWQEAEEELCKLLGQLHEVTRGDLKGLEEQVMQTAFAIGRGLLECILNWCESAEPAQARRVGSCGHGQRLVAERPKELLTLLGKVRLMRPYYQCVLVEKHVGSEPGEESQCTHGEAPADAHWGVHERRTTPGVQQTISALCASLTLEEAAATLSRLVPLEMSARQALSLMQPVGEALASREDEQVEEIWQQARQTRTVPMAASVGKQERIERFYVQMDGVMARLR